MQKELRGKGLISRVRPGFWRSSSPPSHCCISIGLHQAAFVNSWVVAFITLFLNWQVVFLAVGDQIVRNWRSGRADKQLSWMVFLPNIVENFAWVLLGWGVSDPVVVLARIPGMFFDQIVFWQMLWTTKEAERKGKFFVWLKYGSIIFAFSVAAVTVVPLFLLSELRAGQVPKLLKYFTGSVWLVSALGWAMQFRKNQKSDVLTGRDFSPKIPILVEFFLASWILNEYFNGHTGLAMYLINSVALVINTVLLIQSFHYVRLWRTVSPGALQALELSKEKAILAVTNSGCHVQSVGGEGITIALSGDIDIRALLAAGAEDRRS